MNEPISIEQFPNFVNSRDINPELTRYVFFPGDILSTRRKQETRDVQGVGLPLFLTRGGGDEHGSPCLLRTKGYLPRALITPVEIAAFWMPVELVAAGATTFAGPPTQGRGFGSTLVGERRLPGDAIYNILTSSQNDQGMRRGAVELTALMGWKYEDTRTIQSLFFPRYPALPVTLREIEDQIRVVDPTSDDVAHVQEDMLRSCEEFRQWAISKIQMENALVKLGTVGEGFTYSYTDLGRGLMEQLEITPQDQQFQAVARMQEQLGASMLGVVNAQATAKGVDQSEMFNILLANQAKLTEALGAITDRILTAPEPPPSVIPEAKPNGNLKRNAQQRAEPSS